MDYEYVARDDCELPPLIDGDMVLAAGSSFTCLHGYVYGIRHVAFNGGTAQPAWLRQIEPIHMVQQTTVATPALAKDATGTVVVTWDAPMPTADYTISVAKTAAIDGRVSWQVTARTPAAVTVSIKALVALPAATVTVLGSS